MNDILAAANVPNTRAEAFKHLWKMLVSSGESYNHKLLIPLLESLEKNRCDEIDFKSIYDPCGDDIEFPINFNLQKLKCVKGRPGMPYPERVLYRLAAKRIPKYQGITFDNNQIRWIAYWKNDAGKQTQRHFPVYKFGFLKGLEMAIDFREMQNNIINVCNKEKVPISKMIESEIPSSLELNDITPKLYSTCSISVDKTAEFKAKKQKRSRQNHLYINDNYAQFAQFYVKNLEDRIFDFKNIPKYSYLEKSNLHKTQFPNYQYSRDINPMYPFELTSKYMEYARQHCQESIKIHDCELSSFTSTKLNNLEYCFCNCIANGAVCSENLLNFMKN
ncbi:hypothetical protein BmR1_04g07520 [Babesia microti strain RI]|uniref:Uncharacterized protein n=1 Tax=Babesia microti (strain RI) TaxID=1133968 RepID=I7I9V4_BABMR|nr:hypothetical protein BmR1_04g07520 [Babesia microti strain RI]CCF75694.1 hypothetical protein BmR1_04g07520 [Babesia microti strain RI]|eukprot:XP_012650102.1 hypothetical protein BmR1_04g07520 [Babesia microti strain RI]